MRLLLVKLEEMVRKEDDQENALLADSMLLLCRTLALGLALVTGYTWFCQRLGVQM